MRRKKKTLALDMFVSHYHVDRPINWALYFGREAPLDVEIGFGLGDFLLPYAAKEGARNVIGIEQDWERVKRTLGKIDLLRKPGVPQGPADNIRILKVDVTVALKRLFKPESIARVFCLFPCPWPKKRHTKHRLFSRDFLVLLNSRLTSEGQVILVTDFLPFFNWLLEEIPGTGFRFEHRKIPARYHTKYERKWLAAGQEEFFELNLYKTRHQPCAVEGDVPLQVYFADNFCPEKFVFPDQTGETSVVKKDFLYDAKASRAMVHVIVSEKSITQHVWISIDKTSRGWRVAKAQGQGVLPTPGVARAIDLVYQAVGPCAKPSLG